MLSTIHGLKPTVTAPRTSGLFLTRFSVGSPAYSRVKSRATSDGFSGAESLVRSEGDAPALSAHLSSSTSSKPDEGQKEALPPYGIKNSEDLVTFLKPKIKSYDVDMVKEVYQHYVKLNNDGSGLEALEKISATDWLLQWGEGYIELRTSTPKKFWTAWRIFAAFNVKAKGDVAPFPADFLEHLPKDIFDNEFKVAQSRKKQQALFTIHMSSLLSFQGAYFEKEWDEKAVMKKLQSVLSHDPWALMMGHSTFTFKEMEAVSEKFGADLSSPSRGAVALLSTLNAQCNASKASFVAWPDLEEKASSLLGAKFKTPLRQCMADFLDREVVLEFSGTAFRPSVADASERSWKTARCFLRRIYDAEVIIKDFARVPYLIENHSRPLAAQISDGRAPKELLESKGGGSHNVDSQPSPFKEIFLNAIPLERTGAVVPYPDAAIKKASQLQAALTVSYKEIYLQLQGEQDYLERQKSTGAKKPDEDEMTLIEARLKSVKELRQAMERRAAAEKLSQLQLDKKQHQALITAATSRVLVLTGAAGCGKTAVLHPT